MKKPRKPTKARRAPKRPDGKVRELADMPEGVESFETVQHAALGRPTSFKPEYSDQARRLCEVGLTDQEVADFFEVNVLTIHRWKVEHRSFCNALRNAKDISDERVERSLYHRAVGYTFEAEEIFQYQGKVVRAKVRKHVPPDVTAQIFWLKNRRKDEWRDVHRHEFGKAGEFDRLSDAELVTELAKTAQLLLTDQSEPEEK